MTDCTFSYSGGSFTASSRGTESLEKLLNLGAETVVLSNIHTPNNAWTMNATKDAQNIRFCTIYVRAPSAGIDINELIFYNQTVRIVGNRSLPTAPTLGDATVYMADSYANRDMSGGSIIIDYITFIGFTGVSIEGPGVKEVVLTDCDFEPPFEWARNCPFLGVVHFTTIILLPHLSRFIVGSIHRVSVVHRRWQRRS
eukprot:SAG31_NODE_943_length_10852_cov_22.874454_2_plen_198_part_00